jgi:hypothetical protein
MTGEECALADDARAIVQAAITLARRQCCFISSPYELNTTRATRIFAFAPTIRRTEKRQFTIR